MSDSESNSDSNSILDSLSSSSGSEELDDIMNNENIEGTGSNPLTKRRKKLLSVFAVGATIYYEKYLHKSPCYDREYSGWASLISILNGNPRRCYQSFRMHKEVFFELCGILVNNYGLKPTRSVTVEEQLTTFMMIVGVCEGNRQLQESFQRSGYTISMSFHNVLKACTKMSLDWIRPFSDNTTIHPYIQQNSRYFPHFKDCIGAIDGIHIKASIPCHLQVPFIGRKGSPTQNVMVACDFDMCFTFVLSGWEGSAHDTRIFYSAIKDASKNFPMPPRGYPNMLGFLAPYKGQKYHIPHFQRASSYNSHVEVFNHLHSSLRGTIERTFGVRKKKFQIMSNMPVNISWLDQIALVSSTMAIHNFIRKTDAKDEDFLEADLRANNGNDYIKQSDANNFASYCIQSDETMDKLRDDICTSIVFGRTGVPFSRTSE
ncbi:uncharacterized protein [Henckelia pumila]|uniref:uncharacterized protein isoform X2 n=1 Tax=Henckelia pumila TaxID=405737 RepID=UPI003C6DFD25